MFWLAVQAASPISFLIAVLEKKSVDANAIQQIKNKDVA